MMTPRFYLPSRYLLPLALFGAANCLGESLMNRWIFAILLLVATGNAHAACSVPQIAGDYALMLTWLDSGREGFISGRLELSAGGRAVLRGAKMTYVDGSSLITRDGSATGKIGMAPQCTGYLELTFVHRDSNSQVAAIDGSLVAAGDRSSVSMTGMASVAIRNPAPNNVTIKSNLLASMTMQRINL